MTKIITFFLLWTWVWAEKVTIYRDEYGVPHIFADTEEGVAFGAGYAQAEDRLEQLLRNYRRAEGRMAEIFGGEENFRSDYIARAFRHAAVSRERYNTLARKGRACIEAFQEGVRTFMREHPEQVPEWAPELHPWQAVALERYIIWGWPLGEAHGDLRRANIKPDPLPYRGSNQWLVAGTRTAFGAPIALIDPHLNWYGQFRFYECRLYGGEIQLSGVAIVGTPFPALGHNRYLSIAMTTGGPDTSDVYEEETNPHNPRQYKYEGQWRDMSVRREKIGVKEGDRVRWVGVEIESTHHGPIVARRGNKAYAVAIPYADQVKLQDQIYGMITSRNLKELKEALAMLQLMAQNIMVGTVQGDIYYLRNGRVPIRPKGFNFSRPVPGHTSASEWKGIHPLSDLIQITNPPQGYMQNCNIAPIFMMKDCPLTQARFKDRPYLYDERENLHQRAAMVLELLAKNNRVSVKDAMEMTLSTQVYKAQLWQELLRNAGSPEQPDLKRFYDLILDWNRRSDFDSTGAVAYKYWKDSLGPQLARLVDPGEAPKKALAPQRLHEALRVGAKQLLSHFGSLEVMYGQIFRVGRKGSDADYPVGGGSLRVSGMATPRAIGFQEREDRTYVGYRGQSATQLVILSDPPHSYTVVPLGQSDHPESGHWDDQARELFSKVKMKPTYFLDRPELLKHVTARKELEWEGADPALRAESNRAIGQWSNGSRY
ncbi:MAG: penicillin acylase family protein [Acidobacteriota bacterium]